jgi:hypothetical protein
VRGTSDYDAFAIHGWSIYCKWQSSVYLPYIQECREKARDDAKRVWGEPPIAAGGAARSCDRTYRILGAFAKFWFLSGRAVERASKGPECGVLEQAPRKNKLKEAVFQSIKGPQRWR